MGKAFCLFKIIRQLMEITKIWINFMKRMKYNQKVKRKKDQVLEKSPPLKNLQKMSKIRKNNHLSSKKAQVSIFNDHMNLILLF